MASVSKTKRSAALGIGFWLSSPLIGLLFPTLFTAFLFLSGIVILGQPLIGSESMIYFYGGIACMAVIMLRKLWKSKGWKITPSSATPSRIKPFLFDSLALLGLLGGIFTFLDYRMTIFSRSMDFIAVRESLSERAGSIFNYPAMWLVPFSYLTLGLTILFYEQLRPIRRLIGFGIGLGVPVFVSLGLGGRNYIFDLLILVPWWMLQRPVWGRSIIPRGLFLRLSLFLIAVTASWGLMSISINRSNKGVDQAKFILVFFSNTAVPCAPVVDILDTLNPTLANAVSELLLYWTTSVPTFDKSYQLWELAPDFSSSFSPVLNRRMESLGIIPTTREKSFHYKEIVSSYGIPSNAFSSTPFSLIVSFGRFGGFIAQILFALGASVVFVKSRKRKDFVYVYLSSILFLGCFLWFQKAVVSYPMYEYGIYYSLLYIVLTKKIRKQKNLLSP